MTVSVTDPVPASPASKRIFTPLIKTKKESFKILKPQIRHCQPQETLATQTRGEASKVSKQSHWDRDIVCLSSVMKTQISLFVLLCLYQMAVMSCLWNSSVIRPYDQRALLSSTENFKTNNNKHFEKPAVPQEPASVICLPPVRSLRWDCDSVL